MPTTTIPNEQKERFDEAAKNLEEIQKKIAAFIRPMRVEDVVSKGQWEKYSDSTGVVTRDQFESFLRRIASPVGKVGKGKKGT